MPLFGCTPQSAERKNKPVIDVRADCIDVLGNFQQLFSEHSNHKRINLTAYEIFRVSINKKRDGFSCLGVIF